MFSLYFAGVQQDFKMAILSPILCALFRLAFILIYRDKKTPSGEWRKWLTCFRYGFWWGMDFNAYVFLYSMVLVSIPGAFFASYYAIGDTVRQAGLLIYAVVLYTAFIGRLIFYYHFTISTIISCCWDAMPTRRISRISSSTRITVSGSC